MEVSRIRALRGPNLWSRHTAIEAIVACTDDECNIELMSGFETRLRNLFPEMGFLEADGPQGPSSVAHALELAALGLQACAGCPVTFSRTAPTLEKGVFQVVVEYTEEKVGRLAFDLAIALLKAAADDKLSFDLAEALGRLQELDEDVRLGPSTGSIVQAAVAREIERIERRRRRRAERRAQQGAQPAAGEAAPQPEKPREVVAGSKVRMAGQEMVGVVQSVKGKRAQVAFGQILTTVDKGLLTVVSNNEYREATRPVAARTVLSVDISSRKLNFKDHIDVRGMRAADALDEVRNFIDDALMVGVGTVSILHGKGTGALKEEIRRYLRTVPEIASAVDEHADRGGAGITIVTFDLS